MCPCREGNWIGWAKGGGLALVRPAEYVPFAGTERQDPSSKSKRGWLRSPAGLLFCPCSDRDRWSTIFYFLFLHECE